MIKKVKLSKEIKLVKQEQAFGCVPACIAMVLGKDYWEVAKWFSRDFDKRGIPIERAANYLTDLGFAAIKKDFYNGYPVYALNEEMLKPFADAHIISFKQFSDIETNHAVVMTKDGKFLCPSGQDWAEVQQSIYFVAVTIGIFE